MPHAPAPLRERNVAFRHAKTTASPPCRKVRFESGHAGESSMELKLENMLREMMDMREELRKSETLSHRVHELEKENARLRRCAAVTPPARRRACRTSSRARRTTRARPLP